jgi:hypothetical protein
MKVASFSAAASVLAIALVPSLSLANGLGEDFSWQFQSPAQLQALTGMETMILEKKFNAFGVPISTTTIGDISTSTVNNSGSGSATVSQNSGSGGGTNSGVGGRAGGRGGHGSLVPGIPGELNGSLGH